MNDPRLRGLGLPRPLVRDLDTWYPLGVYPNTQKELDTKAIPRGQTFAPVSPSLDEMMMTNVRQFQIPRFPNDKRFQTKLCAEVVNSVSKLWVTQNDGYGVWFVGLFLHRCHCPMMITRWSQRDTFLIKPSIYLRAPLKHRTFRVFCALVPSLVVEHGS